MSITVTFDLDDSDLEHFRSLMKTAIENASKIAPEKIQEMTVGVIEELEGKKLPSFVQTRMEKLKLLVQMLDDEEWQLPDEERQEVLTSLAYFCEPQDLVPDHIPVLGYLDDAIMIELVVQDLAANFEAYEDFCQFRETDAARRGVEVSRDEWLATKRRELHTKMRERRKKRRGSRVLRFF